MNGINNRLLTIIMPVYNHCDNIRRNLENTIPLVIPYKNDVSIYVSDNASSDGTRELVEKYVRNYPDIVSYHCQQKNITASPNFNHAVHSVNSEYCYILGDDDFIFPEFLPTVLSLMNKYPDIGWFHINSIKGICEGKESVLYQNELLPPFIELYKNGGDLISHHLYTPSFISSNVFKRSLWLCGAPQIKEDCNGYVWFSILCFGALNYKSAYYSIPLLLAGFPEKAAYIHNWIWYYIQGFGQLFLHLDKQIPGIYQRWIKYQQKDNWRQTMMLIGDVVYDKNLYLEREAAISKHIQNRLMKSYFHNCIHYYPKWFVKYISNNFFRLIKLISIIKRKF